MGRVIDSGGVFAPRLESKRIQQGRIPFSERLAEKYLSPTGIAQTATLIGAVPIPKAVSKYFMKEDKPEAESGAPAGPVLTPAQQVASQRVGSRAGVIEGQGAPFAERVGAQVGRGEPTQVATTDPKTREIAEVATFASEKMRDAGIPAATAQGRKTGLPALDSSPKATPETYRLQMELVASGDLSPEDWATGPGILGPKTRRAMAQRDARTQQPPNLTGLPTAAAPVPDEMPAEPYVSGAVTPDPTRAPGPATAPQFQANFPEAPPVTKAARFQKAVADAGFNKFGADMDFMRSVAKFADTEEEVKMVISAMDMVKVPPRTIGDLLTGAHEDRFRKEIMGLFPKLKAAPKPVSDLDKAKADKARAEAGLKKEQTKTEKDRQNKIKAETTKLKGGTKGTGKKGQSLFIKRANEFVSQVNKQISARSTAVAANRAEYTRLKDLVSVASRDEKAAQKSLEDAVIDQSAFDKVKNDADSKRRALEKFDTRTGYTKQAAELNDLRGRATLVGSLGDEAARKFKPELWTRLARQRVEFSEPVSVRQARMEAITEEDEKRRDRADKEESNQRLRARQKQLLDRYKNSSRFEKDFQNHARRAGVSKTPLSDIQKIRQGTLGIEDSKVSDIAAAAGSDYGDPLLYINEVFFAEDNPRGVSLNPPPGVSKYETAQTHRQLQSLLQQGYTPRR